MYNTRSKIRLATLTKHPTTMKKNCIILFILPFLLLSIAVYILANIPEIPEIRFKKIPPLKTSYTESYSASDAESDTRFEECTISVLKDGFSLDIDAQETVIGSGSKSICRQRNRLTRPPGSTGVVKTESFSAMEMTKEGKEGSAIARSSASNNNDEEIFRRHFFIAAINSSTLPKWVTDMIRDHYY